MEHALDDDVATESILARIESEEGVDRLTAERWFVEMLKFLALAEPGEAAVAHQLVPSEPVDAAWHAFILHTRAYERYCQTTFGHYFHHDPAPPSARQESLVTGTIDYLRTRALVKQRYGKLDEELWPIPVASACDSRP